MLCLAHLLAGRYQEALRTLDPSDSEDLPLAMAWILLQGASSPSLRAIGASIGLASPIDDEHDSSTRRDEALRVSMPEEALPSPAAITLADLLPGLLRWRPPNEANLREMQSMLERLAERHIDAATSAKRRSAYARGAHLAVVCAEARSRRGDPASARDLLARVAEERRRWPAFRDELESAINASPSVRGALPSRRR